VSGRAWPVRAPLLPAGIAVAAVANFPDGGSDHARAVRDTRPDRQAGAQEVDVVLPYARLLAGDEAAAVRVLGRCGAPARACGSR
jgi:deoxyribose-phosphate aldolase